MLAVSLAACGGSERDFGSGGGSGSGGMQSSGGDAGSSGATQHAGGEGGTSDGPEVGFELVLPERVAVAVGSSAALEIKVLRAPDSTAAIEISVSGLPLGVSAEPLVLEGSASTGVLTLQASEAANPGALEEATITGSGGEHEASGTLRVWVRGAPGSIDEDFGASGAVVIADQGYGSGSLYVHPDDRILVSGNVDGASTQEASAFRFLADGSTDDGFGVDGQFSYSAGPLFEGADAVAVLPDGDVMLGGYTYDTETMETLALVVRATKNGSLDTTFASSGKKSWITDGSFYSAAVRAGNEPKVVFAGAVNTESSSHPLLASFLLSGEEDPKFGTAGVKELTAIEGSIAAATWDADHRLVTAGYCSGAACILRLGGDGELDGTWGDGGVLALPEAEQAVHLALEEDGDYVSVGNFAGDWVLSHSTPAGAPAQSFNSGSSVTFDLGSADDRALGVAVAPEGYYVVGTRQDAASGDTSQYKVVLARFLKSGDVDATFGDAGLVEFPTATTFVGAVGVARQSDGRLVVAQRTRGTDNLLLYRVWN